MPKRKRPTRKRRKRKRRSLYRGRRTQSINKPLVLASRFRKLYFTISLPKFQNLAQNDDYFLPPLGFRLGNIYDPLSLNQPPLTSALSETAVANWAATGFNYGPARGHDPLSMLFKEYRVHSAKVVVAFQPTGFTNSVHGAVSYDAGDFGCEMQQFGPNTPSTDIPSTYDEYYERFGTIATRDMNATTGAFVKKKWFKLGAMENQSVDNTVYTNSFYNAQPNQSEDMCFIFMKSSFKANTEGQPAAVGDLTLTIEYNLECLTPNSRDDLPSVLHPTPTPP